MLKFGDAVYMKTHTTGNVDTNIGYVTQTKQETIKLWTGEKVTFHRVTVQWPDYDIPMTYNDYALLKV